MRNDRPKTNSRKRQRLELRTEAERKCDANPMVPAQGRHMLESPGYLHRPAATVKAL